MKFFDALEILEKDLKKYLGISLPNKIGSGLQFVNIMQDFVDNIKNEQNEEPIKTQHPTEPHR